MASKRSLAKRPEIDPDEEPGQEWGWHGSFPRAGRIAGVISIIGLLAMLVGNHETHTEDIYLVGVAILLAAGLVYSIIRQRNAWRR